MSSDRELEKVWLELIQKEFKTDFVSIQCNSLLHIDGYPKLIKW